MLVRKAYYLVKPLIPRRLQIGIRRIKALNALADSGHIWPIDSLAAAAPQGWTGWPEGRRFAFILTHDVESAEGQGKCRYLAEAEEELGFRSSYNFVAEEYAVSEAVRRDLIEHGFEVGVHGLSHDGSLYRSRKSFVEQASRINNYLKGWQAVGFRSPSMHHNLEWIHDLNIEYDSSTFDTDPFEPQPDGVKTIFPFWVNRNGSGQGYVELPYTLPQDFTLFIILRQKNIDIWKKKIDWVAEHGGMVLVNTHPDYMNFNGSKLGSEEYPADYYREMIAYIKTRYKDQYWHALPKEMARFWSARNGR